MAKKKPTSKKASNPKSKNLSEAMKGNKNAEKWDENSVLSKLEEVYEVACKPDVHWLGEALIRCDIYKQIWSEWKIKFTDSVAVSELIKKVEQKTESKIVSGALNGDLNTTMSIFVLKNKHKWRDTKAIEAQIEQKSTDNTETWLTSFMAEDDSDSEE